MLRKSIVLLVILLMSLTPVFAATGDTLIIGGAVPLILTLVVTPDAGADDLTLRAAAATVTPTVGTVEIEANNSAGWELWVHSTNADATNAMMLNADGDPIAYLIEYDKTLGQGTGVATNVGAELTSAGLKIGEDTAITAEGTPEQGALVLTYDTAFTYPAGYYSDLLTITLRAK